MSCSLLDMLCTQNRRESYYIIEKVAKTFEAIIIVYLSLRVDLKQSFINLVFDRKIYLFNEGVRTAFLNPLFFYNSNKINSLEALKIEKVDIKMPTFPSGGAEGITFEKIYALLDFIYRNNTAA